MIQGVSKKRRIADLTYAKEETKALVSDRHFVVVQKIMFKNHSPD